MDSASTLKTTAKKPRPVSPVGAAATATVTAATDTAHAPLVYRRIYDDLAGKISGGEIGYMEQLPVLPDLCVRYEASHVTVRRALEELERDGYIRRQRGRGKGTFAIKRTSRVTVRVLLVGDQDIFRSPIELCYEVFDLLAGIREAASEHGATVQTISPQSFDTLPHAQGPRGSLGYVVIAMNWPGFQQGAELAAQHNTPFVLVNSPRAGYPCVRVDMEEAAFQGVRHLAQIGHRRIAYVGDIRGEWHAPRWSGYQRALTQSGLEYDHALVAESNGVNVQQDEAALDRLLALPEPPTAVFACSDYRALHLMAHCRRKGISIPGDLSLCGYDDIGEAADVEPSLTTVRHPRYEQGKEAVALLLDQLAWDPTKATALSAADLDRRIAPHVVVRASSAPLRSV